MPPTLCTFAPVFIDCKCVSIMNACPTYLLIFGPIREQYQGADQCDAEM